MDAVAPTTHPNHHDHRNGGRAARRQKRLLEIPMLKMPFRQPRNPWAPLEMLALEQIEQLHLASMKILEDTGIDMWDDEAADLWQKAGAKVDGQRHVWIDRGLLMELVAKAPESFTHHARNPAHNLFMGGNAITFTPQAGMAYVASCDMPRRPGTLEHLTNFVKLGQMCPALHTSGGAAVEPQDVPVSVRHLRRALMVYTHTDKVTGGAAHGREIATDAVNMAKVVFGASLPDQPVLSSNINASSPLRYDSRMLGGAITYARAGQYVTVTPFIMAGAMSPITIAAAIAQQNAEALAGIATLQLARPGAFCIYGGFTTNIDMKTGAPAFGTPEGAWAMSVGAQLARHYKLPYRGSGSLCTAKVADAQAAYETMWTLWPAVMSNTNLVVHAAGWLDGGLTTSYEKFILDVEVLAMFQHFFEGFQINEDTLALDMIQEVGPGGHHFGTPHTQARYLTEFYQSSTIGDRLNWENWEAAGSQTAEQRASTLWKEMLKHYEQPPMEAGILDGLKDYVARRERELEGKSLYENI
jgi:trimethylamine--corrinoid protein Co-methyltransferase